MTPARLSYPVVGLLVPDVTHSVQLRLIEHPFDEYATATMHGMARVRPGDGRERWLEILVIVARQPGRGDCSRFIDECRRAYDRVTIYEIDSERLEGILARRGFVKFVRYEASDGMCSGMEWRRTPPCEMDE